MKRPPVCLLLGAMLGLCCSVSAARAQGRSEGADAVTPSSKILRLPLPTQIDPQKGGESDSGPRPATSPQESVPGHAASSTDGASDAHKIEPELKVNPITDSAATSGLNYKPLNGHQRWDLYKKQNFTTVGAYLGTIFTSLMDQAGNQPPEWGGGMAGYGKRFASRFGSSTIQGSIQAAGDAALKLDPRYIRSVSHNPAHRVGHALLYTFLTNNDDGKARLNLPNLGAYYASSMLAIKWQPSRYTVLGDGVRDANRQVATSAVFNVVQEFWPEINRGLKRIHINLE